MMKPTRALPLRVIRYCHRTQVAGLLVVAHITALSGCKGPVQPPAPEPPKVTVARPVQKDVQLYYPFTGRTVAVERVEIRARVQGFLEKIHFNDSADVVKDQELFTIEPRPYQASLERAQALLESRQAALKLAEANYARAKLLIDKRAISQQELEVMEAELSQAAAAISAAKAEVHNAQIELDYTSVLSPIDGRIDRSQVDVGNLVGGGEDTLLATVNRLDPIEAYFDIDERTLLKILDGRDRTNRENRDEWPPVYLARQNDADYPFAGQIDFIDNEVDPDTGTIIARGLFPNKEEKLVPGFFVRLRVPTKVSPGALLVNERAIGTDMNGKYVLVVAKENLVELRRVELGPMDGSMRVITSGLSAEDQVIVEGVQRARPGMPVQVQERAATDSAPAANPEPEQQAEPNGQDEFPKT
jgi:RND family efflux transporter MFP subunit